MDAFDVLEPMHKEAKASFQKIFEASPDQRAGLWRKLEPELKLHEQVEERFVYEPVARDLSNDTMLRDWSHQHHTQVTDAERQIQRIDGANPTDSNWLQMVEQLHGTLAEHIRMEEGDIWPRIRQSWDRSKLEEAGRQIEAAKNAGSISSTGQRTEHAA
jgi:hypothetical protein